NSCPPCRRLSPTIHELAEEYKGRATVCKVDLDLAPELAHKYSIRGIPAVLFFMQGREVNRKIGLSPKSTYTTEIDRLLQAGNKE
ncbi:MAG: thioredoxin, partial [Spartobacteria bacterium]|nr:thioredoxin [Spartobacteria bacterium]